MKAHSVYVGTAFPRNINLGKYFDVKCCNWWLTQTKTIIRQGQVFQCFSKPLSMAVVVITIDSI